jgi:hypothetical protein
MSRRDGYGTVQLRGFDVDHIPSAPFNPHAMTQSNPQHLTLEDDTVTRRRKPEIVFNPDTGILRVDLFFNNPEREDVKQLIKQVIKDARPRGLVKVVVIIAAETAAAVETYAFFSRNKFERNGFEPAGYLRYEKAVEPRLSPADDEVTRRADMIKARAEQARAERARVEQDQEVNQPTTVPNFLQRKYDEEMKRLKELERETHGSQ